MWNATGENQNLLYHQPGIVWPGIVVTRFQRTVFQWNAAALVLQDGWMAHIQQSRKASWLKPFVITGQANVATGKTPLTFETAVIITFTSWRSLPLAHYVTAATNRKVSDKLCLVHPWWELQRLIKWKNIFLRLRHKAIKGKVICLVRWQLYLKWLTVGR